jgi:hypothetical protein
MGQCPLAQAPTVAGGNSTIHFNDFAVINANSRMKMRLAHESELARDR